MRKFLFFLFLPFFLQALSLKDAQGDLLPAARELLTLMDVPDIPQDELISYLKEHWMQSKKERWEMDIRSEEKKELALPLLRELGCIETLNATEQAYDYALVLGATGPVMQMRLDFLYTQHQNGVRFSQIVLLSGDRKLSPKRDGEYEDLENETQLLCHLFANHPLSKLVPHSVIDSKQQLLDDGTMRRPTTANTLIDWLETNPPPGKCLALSTQPFVGYQEAVARTVLPSTFSIEGIGPALNSPYPLAIYLDNFAKWLLYEKE